MLVNKSIRPNFSEQVLIEFLSESYGITAARLTNLGSYIDQNFLVVDAQKNKLILKIHDGAEQKGVVQLQIDAVKEISNADHTFALPHTLFSINNNEIETLLTEQNQQHYVRVTTFIEGDMLKDLSAFSDQLLSSVGSTVATTDSALKNFYQASAARPDIPWDLKNARQVSLLTTYIKDPHKRRLVDFFFMKFENEVEEILFTTRKSVIHADLHRYSMMVNDGASEISGLIDFGDIVYSHTVCNIAVCLSDIVVGSADPIVTAAKVVSAYHQTFPLTEEEIGILHYLICTRLAIYLTMAAVSQNQDSNNSHAQLKEQQIYQVLKELLKVNPIQAEDCFRVSCGFPSILPDLKVKGLENLNKRHAMFSNMLYTHYQHPLHLTSGALQYLYDDQGNTYFDCVNNVSQWGHSNPHIVKPAQKQISRLNTNSRYVYDVMTDYAEQLLETFPEELDVVFFCNSGSEANDLAMRIAKTVTSQEDMIVIDTAYHGHTSSCTDISPNRIDRPGKPGLPSHVHKIPAPDVYRGLFRSGESDIGDKYANELAPILCKLKSNNKAPAAFIAESLVGTGGQFVLPENYLKNIYKQIRSAGGLCIADEVQVGFARTGDHFWCFESQGVVPDIVTFGKPMGNGHPMAALVTKRSIVDKFDNGVTFFNTFSANPVSCAFGKAVLDVLENDELKANTQSQSKYLFAGLHKLQQKHACIGDVRGKGLYIGVELVTCRKNKYPATDLAKVVIEAMKDKFILLNTNGYDNNIIKIKPALIIEQTDVEHLIRTLDDVLTAVSKTSV